MGLNVCSPASRSIMPELTSVAYSVAYSHWRPTFFQLRINSGRFSTTIIVPMGACGMKKLMIWATPVKPPTLRWLGSKHQLKPTAYSAQDRVIMAYCPTIPFSF